MKNWLPFAFLLLSACAPLTQYAQDAEVQRAYSVAPGYRYACTNDTGLAGATITAGKNVCAVAVKAIADDSNTVNAAVRINYEAAVGTLLAPKWDARWIDLSGSFPISSRSYGAFQFPVFSPPRADIFGDITRSFFESLLIAAPGILGNAIGVQIPGTTDRAVSKFITDSINAISQLSRSNKLRFISVQVCFNVQGSRYTSKTGCFIISKP